MTKAFLVTGLHAHTHVHASGMLLANTDNRLTIFEKKIDVGEPVVILLLLLKINSWGVECAQDVL